MRWLRIRKARIDPELRTTLEQYGVPVMQQVLSTGGNFRHKGQALWVEAVRDSVLGWLTERYDRDERKETWQIVLEVFVIILIGVEIVLSGVQLHQERGLFKEQQDESALQQQAQQKTIGLLSTAETALETLSNNVKTQEAAQKAQQRRKPAFELSTVFAMAQLPPLVAR
jgi:hypothetical protein